MINKFVQLTLLLILIAGCNPKIGGDMSEEEIITVKEEVKAKVEEYVGFMKQSDAEGMLGFWADTDDFVFAGDGQIIVGYEKFAAKQRDGMKSTKSVSSVELSNINVYVLAADAASFTFQFEWRKTKTNGDKVHSRGTWTYVFKKFGDVWKVVHSTGTHENI